MKHPIFEPKLLVAGLLVANVADLSVATIAGVGQVPQFFWDQLVGFVRQNPYVVFLAVWGVVRAMGTTVRTGYTGLFFSFGRAGRVLPPGFVLLIPHFQKVKVMPTRSRTMDLPYQKVTSADGLVWFVDVNLVYRVVDIRKALIDVDNLLEGMEQMLGISVQEIVRAASRDDLRLASDLDALLVQAMEGRLEPWGVEVERAGFTSIRPSVKTLRMTQQRHTAQVRQRSLQRLEDLGMPRGLGLAMLGSASIPVPRAGRARRREQRARRNRRLLRALRQAERNSPGEVAGKLRKQIRRSLLRA